MTSGPTTFTSRWSSSVGHQFAEMLTVFNQIRLNTVDNYGHDSHRNKSNIVRERSLTETPVFEKKDSDKEPLDN